MQEWLHLIVSYIVPAIQAVGVAIVVWGVVEAVVRLLQYGWALRASDANARGPEEIRLAVGERLVLALEFFIASDVIQTVVVPSWESLGILAGIVAIRTVIVYFLEWELRAGTRDATGSPDARGAALEETAPGAPRRLRR